MDLGSLKKCTQWFGVTNFKALDDPSGQMDRKELVVSLDHYPHDFALGPNPREPRMNTEVSRHIAQTLEENHQNFHLLNRGITVVAKGLQYDNKSQRVRLSLHETDDEERYFGILDGGNTNARINQWRQELSDEEAESVLSKAFVNMTVLIPTPTGQEHPSKAMGELIVDISDARNTSVQVKTKSLADARRHFERLKSVLEKETYFDRISWHEGDKGSIDAVDIISLLMIFYPRFCEDAEVGEPYGVYGHKNRCLDAYLKYAETEPAELEVWLAIVPMLLRLFDELQLTFAEKYTGYFGKIKDVRICDEDKYEPGNKKYRKTPVRSKFLDHEMRYSFPIGWIYPIFAGFRVLVGSDDSGKVKWRKNPIKFWQGHGLDVVRQFQPHMRELDFSPKKIATSLTCYQAVRHAVSECYKNELLKDHGISF